MAGGRKPGFDRGRADHLRELEQRSGMIKISATLNTSLLVLVEHFDGRWAAVELASIFGLRDDVIVE